MGARKAHMQREINTARRLRLTYGTGATSRQYLVARLGFKPLIHFPIDRKTNNVSIVSISRILKTYHTKR